MRRAPGYASIGQLRGSFLLLACAALLSRRAFAAPDGDGNSETAAAVAKTAHGCRLMSSAERLADEICRDDEQRARREMTAIARPPEEAERQERWSDRHPPPRHLLGKILVTGLTLGVAAAAVGASFGLQNVPSASYAPWAVVESVSAAGMLGFDTFILGLFRGKRSSEAGYAGLGLAFAQFAILAAMSTAGPVGGYFAAQIPAGHGRPLFSALTHGFSAASILGLAWSGTFE